MNIWMTGKIWSSDTVWPNHSFQRLPLNSRDKYWVQRSLRFRGRGAWQLIRGSRNIKETWFSTWLPNLCERLRSAKQLHSDFTKWINLQLNSQILVVSLMVILYFSTYLFDCVQALHASNSSESCSIFKGTDTSRLFKSWLKRNASN